MINQSLWIKKCVLTLQHGQKAYYYQRVLVCTMEPVANITNRHVKWGEVILPGSDRDCCLVAPKDNQHKYRAMRVSILCDDVLYVLKTY